MQKHSLIAWVNIIKPLRITSFKSIIPKILISSRVKWIHLIIISHFSVINKNSDRLFGNDQTSLLVNAPYSQTFAIVNLVITPPVFNFVVSFTVTLHTA